jgi:hypothetical protein
MASLMVTVAAEELDAGCGSSVRVKAMAEEVVPLDAVFGGGRARLAEN